MSSGDLREPAFYAHSANAAGMAEDLRDHLEAVALRAGEYAAAFGAADEARLAGLLHDLGKYGERFQERLRGREHGIDHWSAGAWEALIKARAVSTAVAIQGHHLGLQQATTDALGALSPGRLSSRHPYGLRLSADEPALLVSRFEADGLALPEVAQPLCGTQLHDTASAMLDVRLLFSALVDADFLETEAHFKTGADGTRWRRPAAPPLQPDRALAILQEHLRSLQSSGKATLEVMRLRADLLDACVCVAPQPPGLFTLSAPTGAGKTLSMLAFALKHAAHHGLRRVVLVIPYLTIIEQTARVYREVLAPHFGRDYLLEHHSLAGARGETEERAEAEGRRDRDSADEGLRAARLLAENWDAPVIVTTSVQFLESLFSNRPSACRRLHRLAKSVILFDEVQTLPAPLALPTLATLSRLVERYGATVLFATATQPAFSSLHAQVKERGNRGWMPTEVVPPHLNLFDRARRTRVHWPELQTRTPWPEIAGHIARLRQVLCIVNLKRHATQLLDLLKEAGAANLFHLSTNLCPAHRERVLADVRARLDSRQPCRLIATQCVEAGVDVDFPVVFRAWGPLDAIAQAAGRCNRNGHASLGDAFVFLPDDDQTLYPGRAYEQAADVAGILLKERGPEGMDIHDPALFQEYYRTLYDLTRLPYADQGKPHELRQAIRLQDFQEVARLYRVIDQDTVNLLVPYDPTTCARLADEVRREGLTATWIRAARAHSVAIYRPHRDHPIRDWLEAVPLTRKEAAHDWFIYLNEEGYDRELRGLVPPEGPSVLIA